MKKVWLGCGECAFYLSRTPLIIPAISLPPSLHSSLPSSLFLWILSPRQNKKQRTVVREAVLRLKDPLQILQELAEIEKTELEAGEAEVRYGVVWIKCMRGTWCMPSQRRIHRCMCLCIMDALLHRLLS